MCWSDLSKLTGPLIKVRVQQIGQKVPSQAGKLTHCLVWALVSWKVWKLKSLWFSAACLLAFYQRFPEPLPGKLGQRLTAWNFRTSSDPVMLWSTLDFITQSVFCSFNFVMLKSTSSLPVYFFQYLFYWW